MPRRFRLLPPGVEGQYFKLTAEGWVFGAPRPWLKYGPRSTYLVTDAQKAALASRVRMSRYLRLPLAIPMAAAMFLLPRTMPSSAWIEAAAGILIAYIMVAHFVEYLAVRPLIVGLPLAAGRMTLVDMHRQQSKVMSTRAQAVLCGFFGLVCAGSFACLPLGTPEDRQIILFIARFSGFLFVIWLIMLIMKLWGRRG